MEKSEQLNLKVDISHISNHLLWDRVYLYPKKGDVSNIKNIIISKRGEKDIIYHYLNGERKIFIYDKMKVDGFNIIFIKQENEEIIDILTLNITELFKDYDYFVKDFLDSIGAKINKGEFDYDKINKGKAII